MGRGLSRPDTADLPDIHVVKFGSVAGLYLDLLGHFPVGIDPVALKRAEDAIEAALFNSEPTFQSLDHLPIGMRIFQVQVKRGRIGGADPFKSSLAAPEFHAALEVRVEDPHGYPPPRPWMDPAIPEVNLLQDERIRAR